MDPVEMSPVEMVRRALVSAAEELASNRVRTVVTASGLAVAVAAFMLIVQLGDSARRGIDETVTRTQGRAGTVAVRSSGAALPVLLRVARQACHEVRSAGQAADCAVTVPLAPVSAVMGGSSEKEVTVISVAPGVTRVLPGEVLGGRWLTDGDARSLGLEAVLSLEAAQELSDAAGLSVAEVVGLTIGFPRQGLGLRIVGVVEDSPLVRFLGAGPRVFVAGTGGEIPAALSAAGLSGSQVEAFGSGTPRPGLDLAAVVVSHQRAALDLAGAAGAEVSGRRVDTAGDFAAATAALTRLLGLIAGVALIVGLIGVLNVGLIGVRERLREFALRRAVGTLPSMISLMVLLETTLVIIGGSVLGVLVAVLVSRAAAGRAEAWFNGVPLAPVSLRTVAIGLVTGAVCGLVAGAVPAFRARRLSVIAGLKAF